MPASVPLICRKSHPGLTTTHLVPPHTRALGRTHKPPHSHSPTIHGLRPTCSHCNGQKGPNSTATSQQERKVNSYMPAMESSAVSSPDSERGQSWTLSRFVPSPHQSQCTHWFLQQIAHHFFITSFHNKTKPTHSSKAAVLQARYLSLNSFLFLVSKGQNHRDTHCTHQVVLSMSITVKVLVTGKERLAGAMLMDQEGCQALYLCLSCGHSLDPGISPSSDPFLL